MAKAATLDVTVAVDARRVIAIGRAMAMMHERLEWYGHMWTAEEQALMDAAVAACERENLVMEAG